MIAVEYPVRCLTTSPLLLKQEEGQYKIQGGCWLPSLFRRGWGWLTTAIRSANWSYTRVMPWMPETNPLLQFVIRCQPTLANTRQLSYLRPTIIPWWTDWNLSWFGFFSSRYSVIQSMLSSMIRYGFWAHRWWQWPLMTIASSAVYCQITVYNLLWQLETLATQVEIYYS